MVIRFLDRAKKPFIQVRTNIQMSQQEQVINYYRYCEDDYTMLWRDRKSLGTHFGFWHKGVTTHSESLLRHNEIMAKAAQIQPNDYILDAGCGIGGTSFWLAKNFGTRIEAINISVKQLRKAAAQARKRDRKSLVRFSKKSYYQTGFPDETFTKVWAQESLPHADDKEQFLRESFRVLRKGGKLVTSDYFLTKREMNSQEERLMNRWLNSWSMKNFMTPREFVVMAEKAGFKNVRFIDTTPLIRKSLKRLKTISQFCYPVGRFLEIVGLRNSYQKENMRSPAYCWESYENGLWKHGIICAEK
jgi:tocopherol O-methyltransferase